MENSIELYRFKKNYQEEIVFSIYSVGEDEYLSVSRCYIDKNGDEQHHKYPMVINTALIPELIIGIQMSLKYLNNDLKLFVVNHTNRKRIN